MSSIPRSVSMVLVALTACATLGPADSATAASVPVYKTCKDMNKKYPHGVAKKGAKDKVSGSAKPVTNFKVDTAIYNANKGRDGDKDGVACEKR